MKFYTILILSIILSSCGNSQKDAESEKKAIADSVKKAVLEQINEKERIENVKKFQIEKSNKISELSIQIENLQSDLINEKAKLIEIEKPKFLRSAAEKENQVRNQETIILGIEESIENIRVSLRTLQSSNTTITEYKIEEVIGCWFVPHSATINIKFERNGRFKFNDYNSKFEIDGFVL